MWTFHFFSAFRGRPGGRKAAAKPKRAGVRRAWAGHGGSGRACPKSPFPPFLLSNPVAGCRFPLPAVVVVFCHVQQHAPSKLGG
jgi:hypothetical protein